MKKTRNMILLFLLLTPSAILALLVLTQYLQHLCAVSERSVLPVYVLRKALFLIMGILLAYQGFMISWKLSFPAAGMVILPNIIMLFVLSILPYMGIFYFGMAGYFYTCTDVLLAYYIMSYLLLFIKKRNV